MRKFSDFASDALKSFRGSTLHRIEGRRAILLLAGNQTWGGKDMMGAIYSQPPGIYVIKSPDEELVKDTTQHSAEEFRLLQELNENLDALQADMRNQSL